MGKTLVDRMRRMVERRTIQHHHVVAGQRERPDGTWQRWLVDPASRSIPALHYEGVRPAPMSTSTAACTPTTQVEAIDQGTEDLWRDPALDARRRTLPFILCEYGHAMAKGRAAGLGISGTVRHYPAARGGFVGMDRPRPASSTPRKVGRSSLTEGTSANRSTTATLSPTD